MILSVENVSFEYSDTSVLRDISFCVEEGSFLGIIGSNGAGKSTLMKLILGLLPCQKGTVTLLGQNRKNARYIPGVGYVSQKAASFNTGFPATVREVVSANLYHGLFARRRPGDRELLADVLKKVGMADCENRLIGNLSGGQQQRVFLARALIAQPKILFLDEPTVGIDAKSVQEINELILSLNREGITIVMTNHDTPSLTAMADTFLILSEETAVLKEKKNLSIQEIAALAQRGVLL